MPKHIVGSVRPSQLLWTYGPGALVDLPSLSVVTMGIDRWNEERCQPIEEARLLSAVKKVLGHQVTRLRIPPVVDDEGLDPLSAEGKIGVPVKPFPRWLRCIKCQLLAEYDSGLFSIKANPYRPEMTHFVHNGCPKGNGRAADAVPARFMVACRNGHLDDFPWSWYVHEGNSECSGTLEFIEMGASLQTENLMVRCRSCGAKKNMAKAFGKAAKENLPACRGRHPHLNRFDDDCDADLKAVLLGATNGWFPVSLSVLAIPVGDNRLEQIVLDGWEYFEDVESEAELKITLKTLVKTNALPGIASYDVDEVWKAIVAKREGNTDTSYLSEEDIKVPEWKVMIAPNPPTDWPHFMSENAGKPKGYESYFTDVLQLSRLREVNALVGFTRVEAPEETSDDDEKPPMAPLSRTDPTWVPASEVHGEGIFLRFDEAKLQEWEKLESVTKRDDSMKVGHRGWRNARKLDPEKGYPGARYTMIHTFAHLLIRELALECGYNAASIRERIYAGENMAGVLIYTAAADSDGTLGGLVELGESTTLGRLIDQALERAKVCASDPLCSEHEPNSDNTLHAAACHACTFVSETSCERGNRYLDRAFLVSTFKHDDVAFFRR